MESSETHLHEDGENQHFGRKRYICAVTGGWDMGSHQGAALGAASMALDGLHRLHQPGFLATRFSFAHIAWMLGTKMGEEFCSQDYQSR